jgi:preprotein translocase subunit SecF
MIIYALIIFLNVKRVVLWIKKQKKEYYNQLTNEALEARIKRTAVLMMVGISLVLAGIIFGKPVK